MAELKYAKNIITEYRKAPLPNGVGPNLSSVDPRASDLSEMQKVSMDRSYAEMAANKLTRLLWLDSGVLEGAYYMDFVWYFQASDSGPGPHTHEFDEVLGFLGINPENPRELGGVIELWLDDEKYLLDKSCLVYIPRGLRHCPMIAREVNNPFIHFSSGNGSEYTKKPL